MAEQSKAAKINSQGAPWLAVLAALIGWWDARDTGQAAARRADTKAQAAEVEAQQFADGRLRKAYGAMQEALETQERRMEDLEAWVVDLESWVEDHVEEDSPRTARERESREDRLEAIRRARRARSREPASAELPDYDMMQEEAADEIVAD